MNILVIGGTRFLGPHFVTAAMAHAHRVTIFNRGSRLLPETPLLRQRIGDRRHDLSALDGEVFDAVVDTCAYHPDDVTASAGALVDKCERYCLISSASVYAEEAGDLDERGHPQRNLVLAVQHDRAVERRTTHALKLPVSRH